LFVIKPCERGRRSDAVKTVTVIKDANFHLIESMMLTKKPDILAIVGWVS
jgi:hypothetical protein